MLESFFFMEKEKNWEKERNMKQEKTKRLHLPLCGGLNQSGKLACFIIFFFNRM